MADLGQQLEFGFFPTPDASRLDDLFALVQLAEVSGLDLVSIQDHPYQARFLDTWTLLALLGARTSAIKLSTNVANLPLRPPVVLAKAAATLDLATGGRVELGLGAGAFWDAVVAAGGPRRTPGEAVEALEEAVTLIKAFWAGGTVRLDGEHYSARGLHAGPSPAHDIPIWLGAYKPRMLRLTGRLADGWVPSMGYADPPALAQLSRVVDEAALAAGRSPADVKRIYNVSGQFGSGGGFLRGRPGEWAEQLAGLTLEHGTSTFILTTDEPDVVQRWAAEVAPAVRDLVDAERERAARGGSAPEKAPEPPVRAAATTTRRTGSVAITPDDGVRLTGPLDWDETTRPTAGFEPTGPHPEAGQHLVEVHDHLRAELAQIRGVLDQVREGHVTVGAARSVINTMTMRQNNWTLGAYCESYCRMVTTHHTLEDRSVFPSLLRAEPDLAPVLERLEEEHHVIHDVLEQFDRALVGLVGTDGTGTPGRAALDGVQDAVDLLTDTLLSHLSYEERELAGPLSHHGFA